MDKFTEKWLRKRVKIVSKEIEKTGLMNIENLADSFRFDKRRLSNSYECPCYDDKKFCHNKNNVGVYCLLCSCPNYDASTNEGGCKIGNPFGTGYYYDRSVYNLPDIWDCSDCLYPHTKEQTMDVLNLVKEHVLDGDDLKKVLWNLFNGKLIGGEEEG